MNTKEINKILLNSSLTKNIFIGTYPCDKIPELLNQKKPFCIIINIDEHDKKGSHWVAVYFPQQEKAEYFCSYGGEPKNVYIEDILTEEYRHSTRRVQQLFSAVCGQHCIYFLSKRAAGKTYTDIMNTYQYANFKQNDSMVVAFCRKKFGYRMTRKRLQHFFDEQIALKMRNNI